MFKQKQITDLMAFYPNSTVLKKTTEEEEYLIPLNLSVSKTPLYIRV